MPGLVNVCPTHALTKQYIAFTPTAQLFLMADKNKKQQAKKQTQKEEPQGPGISGLFNVPPTYFLPGTIGDVGAVAIDYPTMRAEPWDQTVAPIAAPLSPQGEIFAAPLADAPSQFATGQQWKDLYDLMATETDVYRKYLQDTHQLADTYFPPIVATNQVPPDLRDASAWYDRAQEKVFLPLYQSGYEGGRYMDVGPTVRTLPSGATQEFVPVITNARNPKMSIRMDMSPLPHEIGHYYDFTGAPVATTSPNDLSKKMSWAYYDQPGLTPWDYIFRNLSSAVDSDESEPGQQSWFMKGEAPPAKINVPAEMFADYFRKALQAGVGLDLPRLFEIYGGKSPVSIQPDGPVNKPEPLTPEELASRQSEIAAAYESARNQADIINQSARGMPNAKRREMWPYLFESVANIAANAPSYETQESMQPALTEEAKQFLYWLFTRGYTPR